MVFVMTEDLDNRIERGFKVMDEDSSTVVMENELKGCEKINAYYS